MPVQAKLEVHRGGTLSSHLGLHRILRYVPPETLQRRPRADEARVWRQVGLVARGALPYGVVVPEGLHQDLLRLEALVEVSSNQPQRGLAVVRQLCQQLAELHRVHEGLGLVCPLALRESLRQLVRDDAVEHQVVQAVGQLLAHDLMEVAGDLRLPAGRVGAERPDRLVRHVEDGGVVDQDLADGVPILVVALHVFSWECLHPVHQRSLLHEVHRRVKVEAATLLIRQLEMAKVQVGICQAILRACKHASVHKLFLGDAPLG
mmetsp:Transcript_110603/g.292011  ORF Transcript_110603/g.292011 Transcript_110603/m.292011 type:complete len:262 (+) Transcript_110603:1000-1785(+)